MEHRAAPIQLYLDENDREIVFSEEKLSTGSAMEMDEPPDHWILIKGFKTEADLNFWGILNSTRKDGRFMTTLYLDREIKARLRQGHSHADIAEACGCAEVYVEKVAGLIPGEST